jgi:hypothetical protein
MPLWCAADHSHEEGGETPAGAPLKARADRPSGTRIKAHSRVVRISPGDSVVLNSAERAPFLLHVEILDGDLDFDPSRRENRELLKKIVVQEDLKRRKKENGGTVPLNLEGFGSPMPEVVSPPIPVIQAEDSGIDHREVAKRKPATLPINRREAKPDEMEEMDLVEQLYGAKLSVRDAVSNLAEIIPLPNAPKNKQLDLAAWEAGQSSRKSSISPTTPILAGQLPDSPSDNLRSLVPSPGYVNGKSQLETPTISQPPTPIPFSPSHEGSNVSPRPIISLEDYSERMRTAAVMLAQLHASQVPAIPENPNTSGSRRWIPGTGWITGSASSTPMQPQVSMGGGLDQAPTSAGGKLKLAAAQAAAIRDRIMEEMMALEEERVERMTDRPEGVEVVEGGVGGDGKDGRGEGQTAEDERIVRRELNKADPSGTSGALSLYGRLTLSV